MPFKATNVIPARAYDSVKIAAVNLKNTLTTSNGMLLSSSVDYDFIRQLYLSILTINNQFTVLKATPGLAQFAKIQENDNTYDVALSFTSMQTTVAAALKWIEDNIPTSVTIKPPSNWGESTLIANTFTPAQTAGLRTVLSAVIAEII